MVHRSLLVFFPGKDDRRGKPSPKIPLIMSVKETFELLTKPGKRLERMDSFVTAKLTKRLVGMRKISNSNSLSSDKTNYR